MLIRLDVALVTPSPLFNPISFALSNFYSVPHLFSCVFPDFSKDQNDKIVFRNKKQKYHILLHLTWCVQKFFDVLKCQKFSSTRHILHCQAKKISGY